MKQKFMKTVGMHSLIIHPFAYNAKAAKDAWKIVLKELEAVMQ